MKSKLLIFIMLMAPVVMQGQVREFQIGALQNSIVRTVDEETLLIYTQSTADSGFFLLYHRGASTALAFAMPVKYEVRDVRIFNRTDAYFCGTYGGEGLIGMFRIASTFAGTDNVHYARCGWMEQGYVCPVDLKRLELFEDGGYVNMAMTGTSSWYQPSPLPNTTVMSAYIDGGGWHTSAYVNKGWYMNHTDVACLDDVIVSVGTDNSGTGCRMKVFQQTQDFPQYAFLGKTEVSYMAPEGEVLVTRRGHNEALLAQYNKGPYGYGASFLQMQLSPTTGLPTAVTSWMSMPTSSAPYTNTWRMMELQWRYPNAWLLQRTEYPAASSSGLTEWMLRVPLATMPVVAGGWAPMYHKSQSMDLLPLRQEPWLSGARPGLAIDGPMWIEADDACHRFLRLEFEPATATWQQSEIDNGFDYKGYVDYVYSPSLFQVNVESVCE